VCSLEIRYQPSSLAIHGRHPHFAPLTRGGVSGGHSLSHFLGDIGSSHQGKGGRPAAGNRAAECPGCQRGLLGRAKTGEEAGPGRLSDAVIDGAAEQHLIVAGKGGDQRADLRSLMQRNRAGDLRGQDRPGVGRSHSLVGPRHHDEQLGRHRQ
jgi:hypothetical protein